MIPQMGLPTFMAAELIWVLSYAVTVALSRSFLLDVSAACKFNLSIYSRDHWRG